MQEAKKDIFCTTHTQNISITKNKKTGRYRGTCNGCKYMKPAKDYITLSEILTDFNHTKKDDQCIIALCNKCQQGYWRKKNSTKAIHICQEQSSLKTEA